MSSKPYVNSVNIRSVIYLIATRGGARNVYKASEGQSSASICHNGIVLALSWTTASFTAALPLLMLSASRWLCCFHTYPECMKTTPTIAASPSLLKVVARRFGVLRDQGTAAKQSGFRPVKFVVRRLQELGWKAGVPLFLCFIDIQKDYDSVDHTLLWQVLARLGLPPQMITVIREFHDRMKACVRSCDDTCSNSIGVKQQLPQECVLSPLLFNVFLAVVLLVILQRFSEDADILAELVHLQEQSCGVYAVR